MRKVVAVVTLCFMILMVFAGCDVLQKLGLKSSSDDELRPVSSIVMGEDEAKKLSDKVPIYLYFANDDNTKLKLEVRYIPTSDAKQSTSHLASVIVNELIKGPSANSGYKATIPAGTKLRTPVSINSGIATVDLSKDLINKHPGGKDAEKMTIYSIVNSLTELKDIQKVKFTIAGKVKKEFKGNFQFDTTFPRSTSLISKESVPNQNNTKKPTDTKPTSGNTQDMSGGTEDVSGDQVEILE